MYKNSVFNFYYKRNEDENVVYNTFSKALVVLSDDELADLQKNVYAEENIETFLDYNIIVGQNDDEIGFLKYVHNKTKFKNDIMFLTIAPTMDCNFACPYCYENRRKGVMSEAVQNGVLEFIEEKIDSGVEAINITWYGGEPLLCFDIVEKMTTAIVEICSKKNCRLKMDMVTNGYLLTQEIVEKIDSLGITKVQITIDGLKEHHDVRRPLKGGKGTFDKIMENLRFFDDVPLPVLIRMNVDRENSRDFIALKNLVDALDNNNIRVYASPVEDINQDTVNEVSQFMSAEEFESFAIKTCDDGSWTEDDFSVMDDRYCFCTSETENCYVIDERGNFYKCWDEVGRDEYCCFNVTDRENVNYNQITKFLSADPFSDEKCKECKFLPLCFGGCKFQKVCMKKSVCAFSDETVMKYIETTFFKENEEV